MAAIVRQQQTTLFDRLKQALKDLDFISWGFSWLFMFASRIAEPLMTLSVLYIIIEAGVPVVHSEALHNLSVGIMIASPELMLPGSFVMASQAKAQGNERKAYMLYAMCWIFVFITIVTLVSLFIFKLDATWFSIVTCARCAAGVGYSILIRVLTHSNQDEQISPEQIAEDARNETREMYEPQLQELRNYLQAMEQQNTALVSQIDQLNLTILETNKAEVVDVLEPTNEPVNETTEQEHETDKLPVPRITMKLVDETKSRVKNETNIGRGTAQQKALRILKKNPSISPTELAKKAEITPQYASKILKSQAV